MKTSVYKLQIWSPQWAARWTILQLREPMTLRQTTITTWVKEATITLSHGKATTIARWWRHPTATTNGWIQAKADSETLLADLPTAKALWVKLAQRLIHLTWMTWSQYLQIDSSMWSLTLSSQRSKARIICGSQLRLWVVTSLKERWQNLQSSITHSGEDHMVVQHWDLKSIQWLRITTLSVMHSRTIPTSKNGLSQTMNSYQPGSTFTNKTKYSSHPTCHQTSLLKLTETTRHHQRLKPGQAPTHMLHPRVAKPWGILNSSSNSSSRDHSIQRFWAALDRFLPLHFLT